MKKMKLLGSLLFGAVMALILSAATASAVIGGLSFVLLFLTGVGLPVKGVLGQGFIEISEGMTEAEKRFAANLNDGLKKLEHQTRAGLLTEEQLNIRLNKLIDENKNGVEVFQKGVNEEIAHLRGLMESGKNSNENKESDLRLHIRNFIQSEDFKSFVDGKIQRTAKFATRAVTMAGNYTGTKLVTVPKRDKIEDAPIRKAHIRDLIGTTTSDFSSIASMIVTSFTDNATVTTENGTATTSSVALAEKTFEEKRIVTNMHPVSKKILRNVKMLENYIYERLQQNLLFVEDAQILNGDGAGNNIDGLKKNIPAFTMDGPSFVATEIASVASYNGGAQAKVTFAANHKIKDGFKITISNATAARYNATFDVNVFDANSILITVAYLAEADTSAWTAVTYNPTKNTIESANEFDVLVQAIANGYIAEYSPNGGIIHPQMATKIISQLKTDAEHQYLNVRAERRNGYLYVDNVPFVETTACPIGEFYVGVFDSSTVELAETTGVEIQMAADVADLKAGQVAFIGEQNVIFCIYNKFLMQQGNFVTAKALLEKP